MILSKYLKTKFSSAMFCVESIIVLVGMVVFADYTLPLYSLISIFVCAKALDFVLDGAEFPANGIVPAKGFRFEGEN